MKGYMNPTHPRGWMKISWAATILILLLVLRSELLRRVVSASSLYPHSGPFDARTSQRSPASQSNRRNFKGRIAFSSDGNYNDEDDWATMTYFLLTGDEDADLAKLESLLNDKKVPAPIETRKYVRIEAENFRTLDNYAVEHRNDRRASHRLSVRLARVAAGRIRTPFNQPYTADSGRYDVDIRYFDEEDGRCQLALYVNGVQKGDSWYASKNNEEWTTRTVSDVEIKSDDEIMVEVRGDSTEYGKLDYVQLNYRNPRPVVSSSSSTTR